MSKPYEGPEWDIASEYSDFGDKSLVDDRQLLSNYFETIASLGEGLLEAGIPKEEKSHIADAQQILSVKNKALILVGNINTWANCIASVDAKNSQARALLAESQSFKARLGVALQDWQRWVQLVSSGVYQEFIEVREVAAEAYTLSRLRLLSSQILTLEEEKMLKTLELNGPTAWGNLYDIVSGGMNVAMPDGKSLGLAQAAAYMENSDVNVRRKAWLAQNSAWEEQEEAVAAGLNAIAGWRLDTYKMRSVSTELHFLDPPCHQGAISRLTLDTMMGTVSENNEVAREVLKAQAACLGIEQLGPWDLFAPPPGSKVDLWLFDDAIKLIRDAFAKVDPDMGSFVDIMVENRWIEGSDGKSKRPGAYCTRFPKSRTPRVYMTYAGGIKDVITLAHELGHAFHGWVMRDMPISQTWYPMTLAETASIFAQTVVLEELRNRGRSQSELLPILWSDAREAEAFLLNIPARYDFEKALYEKRAAGPLSIAELKLLMEKSWRYHYRDCLSEMNKMFWASKLHFHISGISFYNFPYTFGYLFSLGVFSRQKSLGSDFYQSYIGLLRNTGRMTAEDLAKKHMGVDLEDSQFWNESINIVRVKVNRFKDLVAEIRC